jgi:two-component system sensor histidine kinase/response regulator
MSDYVAKPIDEEELDLALGRWLRTAPAVPEEPRTQPTLETAPTPSVPGLDLLAGLRRAGGNEALHRRLLRGFLEELGGTVGRLDAQLAAGDGAAAAHLLHTLKGTSATLGAVRVAAASAALEKELKATPSARPSLDELAAAIEEARASGAALGFGAPSGAVPAATAAGAAAAVGGVQVASLDRDAARKALAIARRLATSLASSDLAATSDLAELRSVLDPRFPGPLGELHDSLERLDFEAARAPLATLLGELEKGSDER